MTGKESIEGKFSRVNSQRISQDGGNLLRKTPDECVEDN